MLRGTAGSALPTRPLTHAHRPGRAQLGMNSQVEAATAWPPLKALLENRYASLVSGRAPAAQAAARLGRIPAIVGTRKPRRSWDSPPLPTYRIRPGCPARHPPAQRRGPQLDQACPLWRQIFSAALLAQPPTPAGGGGGEDAHDVGSRLISRASG